MNLELLTKSEFYILNLNESTQYRWCYSRVKITKDFKIASKDPFKTYGLPEYLNGIIIGFYYYGNKQTIPKLIEELKIFQTVTKTKLIKRDA